MAKPTNVKAIILDKDGVFVDFHKLWLRVIAYRAQLIAEHSTASWNKFDVVRTACIRAMGIDEEEETIDSYAPCSMPASEVVVALKTATFLTIFGWDPAYTWKQASDVVDRAFAETREALSISELSEPIPGAIAKIKEIADAGIKLAVFSSDSADNINASLDKFKIKSKFSAIQGDESKTTELYIALCAKLGVKPSETILVSDAPRDIEAAREAGARTVGVLSGVVSKENIGVLKVIADDVLPALKDLNISKFSSNKIKATKKISKSKKATTTKKITKAKKKKAKA